MIRIIKFMINFVFKYLIMKFSQLPEEEKYHFFINHLKEQKEVWLLNAMEGMYAMIEDMTGQEYVPLWIDKDDAVMHIRNEWSNYEICSMKLNELLSWLNELEKDGIKIAISGENDNKIIPVQPMELINHLMSDS